MDAQSLKTLRKVIRELQVGISAVHGILSYASETEMEDAFDSGTAQEAVVVAQLALYALIPLGQTARILAEGQASIGKEQEGISK